MTLIIDLHWRMGCLPCCHLLRHWKHFSGSFIPWVKIRLGVLCLWACFRWYRRSLHAQWHGRLGVPTWTRHFLYVILNDVLLWRMEFDISVLFEAILCCFTLLILLVDDINTVVYYREILFSFWFNAVYWRISTANNFTIDKIVSLIWLFWVLSTTLLWLLDF